jgi:dTDP-4-dehydrorhamnose 3,5-epimerase
MTTPQRFTATPLALPDVLLISGRRFTDDRGYFFETFRRNDFAQIGIDAAFVQENMSKSTLRGTVRGLHFQAPPYAQAKLVRVLCGAIFDVAVDIRKGSPQYGAWCGATLTAESGEQLYVPHGFAHGFFCLEDNTVVSYKVDNYYDRPSEGGIIWDDPDLGIAWPKDAGEAVLSEKDTKLPRFAQSQSPFTFKG